MSNNYIQLNGTNFRPTEIVRDLEKYGELVEAADGSPHFYFRSFRRTWSLSWRGIHEDNVNAITAIAMLTTSFPFRDIDNIVYTVMIIGGGYSINISAERISLANAKYFDVEMTLTQAVLS